MIKAGIIGSTGYAGQQLVWLLSKHTDVKIVFLCSHSYDGSYYNNIYKNYTGYSKDICINMQEAENKFSDINILFIALPHGKSFNIVKKALDKGVKVIDLGADFRIKNKETYKKWYGIEHTSSNLLSKSIYGLPEINREKIKEASLIANPGCYPTASILALTPLLKNNLIHTDSIIIDAKSGATGAGRSAKIDNIFTECNESIKAYSVACHRHTPEIEQELSNISNTDIKLTFTPHLVPMNRGILSICYATLNKKGITEKDIYDMYRKFYMGEQFVKVVDFMPETRWVRGSNMCHIGLRVDLRTNRIIVGSAIDNLMKGAASQAVQNMNLMFGLEESKCIDFPSMAL
ncbi:N-acetyl-gamma-glutamyl-phosphate reductase [Clostridium fermenticellae]|uniref:N-acetyl-gamma-glutamyl-phosphate reductase n=1 Tax=Clostridium fermenticellae TaxID=2068654 RepID=A0A386H4X3_9CLOT|nr:N-acetyl-gamma-glutamyl-phosphate reductase [Clostridium fermenticellae]AYD40555.1 N-acetyl-gamma-glutamyl-phosphate reductase [Clostridium fermenticellae]